MKNKKELEKIKVLTTKVPELYSHLYKCPHCSHGIQERSRTPKPAGKVRTCPNKECKKKFELDV